MGKFLGRYAPQDLDLSLAEVVELTFGKNKVTGDPLHRYLYLGCNEIEELEDLFDGALGAIFLDSKQRTRMGTTTKVLWVGLKVFDPDLGKSEVGRMLSREIEQLGYLWEKIIEALRKGVPGLFAKAEEQDSPLPATANVTPPVAGASS